MSPADWSRRKFLAVGGALAAGWAAGRGRPKKRRPVVVYARAAEGQAIVGYVSVNIRPVGGTKKLIKYGQDIPTAAQIAANTSHFESMPFDGWVCYHPTGQVQTVSGTSVSQSAYASHLADLPAGLARCTDNWYRVIFTNTLDWADEALWANITANFANLAAAMAATDRQWAGIWIDDEWYGGSPNSWDYGASTIPWVYSATQGATPGVSPEDARDLATARGRTIMDAITAAWPDARVLLLYGAVGSDTKTFQYLDDYIQCNDTAWANELKGALTYGMVQSTYYSAARVYDGGEYYGCREEADFTAVSDWQKTGWANAAPYVLPAGDVASYQATMADRTCIGVYDRDEFASYAVLSAADLTTYLTRGISSSDDYPWLYTEWYSWDGGSGQTGGAVPQSYIDAVWAAKAAAT